MPDTASNQSKTPSTPPREILYSEAAKYAKRAIEILSEIMERGDNDSARLGAAKTILAKAIPDLKAIEISGPDGGPLQLKYIIDLAGGYIPPLGSFTAPPTGSDTGSTPIQGTDLAQASQENNDSSDRTSETGSV